MIQPQTPFPAQQPSLFDYTALPDQTALDLRMAAERIRMRLKRSAEDIIAIGQDLMAAKEQLAHGQFGAWLTAEFEMAERTARNFMQVAGRFSGISAKFADFPVSVIYQLAAPSTPDAVIDRVTSGEVAPTVAEVKQAIAEAKAAQIAQAGAERRATELLQQHEAAQRELHARELQIQGLTNRLNTLANQPKPEPIIETREVEVRVEVPVIPPEVAQHQHELERQLHEAQRERDEIRRRATELQRLAEAETQKHFAGENERRVRLTWHTNASDIQTSLRKIMGLLPSETDTRAFEADDWQKLAAIASLVKRLSSELDAIQDSGITVIGDYDGVVVDAR